MTLDTHARIAALVAAGFLMTSGGAAFADTATSGNGSIGGGNQLGVDVDAPVNLCGNAVGLLGVAGAQCDGSGASVEDAPGDAGEPGHDDGHEEDASSTSAPQPPEEPGLGEDPGTDGPDDQDPGREDGEDPGTPGDEGQDPGQEVPDRDGDGGETVPGDGGEGPDGADGGEGPGGPADGSDAPDGTEQGQQSLAADEGPNRAEASPAGADLAATGTERGPLVGLIAAAVGALAIGGGLLLGLRRRAGA